MDIYVFNKQLNRIGVIDTYNTFIWNRKYYDVGDFELHLPLVPTNLELLCIGNIICKNNDLKEAGYINYRNLIQEENGEEKLIIKGKSLKGYISNRIIWNTTQLKDKAEICIRKLVNENCIVPSNENRKINNLILGGLKNFNQELNYQVSYKNVMDEINKISLMNNLSSRINLDYINKKLIFEVWQGLDRTTNQNINSWVVFSEEYDNVLKQYYVDSSINYKTTCLIAGKGEGAARIKEVLGDNQKGLDRKEVFFDARDIEDVNSLNTRGIQKLEQFKRIVTFDSVINVRSNLDYRKDYDLGDIVTFKAKQWGQILHTRITEIQEVYDTNGFSINCTFGNKIPTLVDVIKDMQNN